MQYYLKPIRLLSFTYNSVKGNTTYMKTYNQGRAVEMCSKWLTQAEEGWTWWSSRPWRGARATWPFQVCYSTGIAAGRKLKVFNFTCTNYSLNSYLSTVRYAYFRQVFIFSKPTKIRMKPNLILCHSPQAQSVEEEEGGEEADFAALCQPSFREVNVSQSANYGGKVNLSKKKNSKERPWYFSR